MAPPEAHMHAEVFAGMSPEVFIQPDRFAFMAQGALIANFLIEDKGTQEEWVERYAAIFRRLLPERQQAWQSVTGDQKTRSAGLRAIQEELDAALQSDPAGQN